LRESELARSALAGETARITLVKDVISVFFGRKEVEEG
jgi:molecular chaperone DnaK (HSP70)